MITALSPPGDLPQYLRVDKQGGREWRFKVREDMPVRAELHVPEQLHGVCSDKAPVVKLKLKNFYSNDTQTDAPKPKTH